MPKIVLDKEKFIKKVLAKYRFKKFKKATVASMMGIDRSYLHQVLKGDMEPGKKFIEGALNVCGCGFDELFSLAEVVNKTTTNKAG